MVPVGAEQVCAWNDCPFDVASSLYDGIKFLLDGWDLLPSDPRMAADATSVQNVSIENHSLDLPAHFGDEVAQGFMSDRNHSGRVVGIRSHQDHPIVDF
jgi:hypothetical protein